MRKFWLLKSEPETYSWADLERLGEDHWDGVRNYQARNFIREMSVGDQAFFYHSGKAREIVGIANITSAPYQDPTTEDDRWLCVNVKCDQLLPRPVGLAQIKADPFLSEMILLRNSRLSVQPVTDEEFSYIVQLSKQA
jgi:predicted RNA-binding protein with PUA-like domain